MIGDAGIIYQSRSLWFENNERCGLRHAEVRASDHTMIVRTLYSGISRGTESLVFEGKVPPSEYERMRAPYQEGDFPFPVKYGYSAVGVVEDGPKTLVGKTVFVLHPHQDLFAVRKDDVHVLPDQLVPARAVLAANMETALNIVWDAQIGPGDRIAVFGAGIVGLLVTYIASRIIGTDVTICDVNPERAATATQLGVCFEPPDGLAGEYDCLINASASADALKQAIGLGSLESRIVEASWYGHATIELPLGGAFHAKRLSIVSSQVGSLPERMRSRWDRRRRMSKALELLMNDRLDCLITGETSFDNLMDQYAAILGSPATLCHRIVY